MKTFFSTILLCIFITHSSFGQEKIDPVFNYGVKAGVSTYSFSKDRIDATSSLSFYAGGYSNYRLNSTVVLQAELLFESYGMEDKNLFNTETDLLQLTLPVFIKFEAKPNLFFNLGGFAGYHLDLSTDSNLILDDDYIKEWNAGLLAGVEYHLNSGLFLEVRYNHGLVDLQDTPRFMGDIVVTRDEIKTRSFFFGVGFQF